MERLTAEQLAERALDLGLVSAHQLQEVWAAIGTRAVGLDEFVQAMVRREYLTRYQIDRILKGEKTGYFYGDYKVLYRVGAGTFARVFRAVHQRTGQVVALKVLREQFSKDPAQYGLFVREGELGRSLRHPNIVPIYEVHSRGKQHFLVMEFIEGSSLRELVKVRQRIPPGEATRLMIDIASALEYAFRRSVTHRDLRISNVLVSSDGRAMLADFGLAAMETRTANRSDGEAATARTVDYAALEQATGVRRDDTRSDLFFAGCIYYHILSGKAPLPEGPRRMQRLTKSQFAEIVPIQQAMPSLPLYVTYVVNKAMALEPARRYQTPAELLADLETAKKRLDTEAQAAPPGEPAPTGQQDERRILVVESNPQMQDLLRQGLKRVGFRVLLTSDPRWAFDRLAEDRSAAEGLILSAQELGESALEWFNRLAAHPRMRSLPTVLLLGENQRPWLAKAQTSPCRKVLPLPITMGQLRATLGEMLQGRGESQQRGASEI